MDPQRRTRLLGLTFIGLLLLWGGSKVLTVWVLNPIREKKNQIVSLKDQIEAEEKRVAEIKTAQRDLLRWKQQSLPPDGLDAQRVYKNWVNRLAEVTGFDDLSVEPGRREPKAIRRGRIRKPLYTSVQVKLKGRTTFDRLCRFLYYVHRTDLTHRVSFFRVKSEGNEGNPYLAVELYLDGLALADAAPRKYLFPETELARPLQRGSRILHVSGGDGFPQTVPFSVLVGRQMLTVTQREKTVFTVRPGVDPPPHSESLSVEAEPAGAPVEWIPLTLVKDRWLSYYRRHLFGRGKSPFVLPVPYHPRLDVVGSTTVRRGEMLQLQVRAVDLNPDEGPPRYQAGSPFPAGMKIDPRNGRMSWTPPASLSPGTYPAEVLVLQGQSTAPVLRQTLRLAVVIPNDPPVLSVPRRQAADIGRTVSFRAQARDPDGPQERLRFSLSGAPAGATIDPVSGRFEWTPTESVSPGRHEFEVIVTDGGTPPQQSRQRVVIEVRETPQRYTKLIAIITEEGRHQAWLYDVSTNRKTVLQEGEFFEAAGLAGFVYLIGQNFIEFQTKEGDSYRLLLGQFLSQREKLLSLQPGKNAEKPPERKQGR